MKFIYPWNRLCSHSLLVMMVFLNQSFLSAQFIGIGTDTPIQPLTVEGSTNVVDSLGIGNAAPGKKLDVSGDALINGLSLGRGHGGSSSNTVFGFEALHTNIINTDNLAFGYKSLTLNTSGGGNVSIGANTLTMNTTGAGNTAIGESSLQNNTTGFANTAIGKGAGPASGALDHTTAIGYNATVSTSNSVVLGNGNVNVGIGTSTPSEKLDVSGLIKTTNLQMTTGATENFIMKSDATGNSTWANLNPLEVDPQISSTTTGRIPRWNTTTLTDGTLFDNETNVGLGNTSPVARLDIRGNNIGIRMKSGATGSKTSMEIGRTATEGVLGVAGVANDYAVGSGAGDVILQQNNNAQNLILSTGSGSAALTIKTNKVGIGTTAPVNTLDVEGALVVGNDYSGTAVAPANGALIQGFTGIGTYEVLNPLHIVSPFPKTDNMARHVSYFTTNEPLSSNPFALRFSITGAPVAGSRYIRIQTTDVSLADGGTLALQPAGGQVGIGTTAPVTTLDVEGGIYNHFSGVVTVNWPWNAFPVEYYIEMATPLPAGWDYTNTVVLVTRGASDHGGDIRRAFLLDADTIRVTFHTMDTDGVIGNVHYCVFKI